MSSGLCWKGGSRNFGTDGKGNLLNKRIKAYIFEVASLSVERLACSPWLPHLLPGSFLSLAASACAEVLDAPYGFRLPS